MGLYSFVCFCFFVLCYYAVLTRQFTVSFFCLVPVHTLSGLIWNKIQVHLKDIGIDTVW